MFAKFIYFGSVASWYCGYDVKHENN